VIFFTFSGQQRISSFEFAPFTNLLVNVVFMARSQMTQLSAYENDGPELYCNAQNNYI
jgi:hypothetical protein